MITNDTIKEVQNGILETCGGTRLDMKNAKIRLANTKKNKHQYATNEAWEKAMQISKEYVNRLEFGK